jgi:cytochrome c553
MKIKIVLGIACIVASLIATQSCKKNNSSETNISATGGNKSHNMGQNCMNCHKSGGQGEGWFNLAGTVYTSSMSSTFSNAIVKLYTGPNATGTLKYTINGDAKGNFYTTETIDFGAGLYPVVQGTNSTNKMSSAIITGQCNSCHGVSTDKIWTN